MFTYAFIYIFFYYQILFIMFIFFILYVKLTALHEFTLATLLGFLKSYSSHYNYFFILPLLLSGLPPMMFFLVKFSFLLKIFSHINLIIQLIFFINFFLNMLFYLQYFNITNTQVLYTSHLLTNSLSILTLKNNQTTKSYYTFWYLYSGVCFLNIWAVVFYFDIYIIFSNFF